MEREKGGKGRVEDQRIEGVSERRERHEIMKGGDVKKIHGCSPQNKSSLADAVGDSGNWGGRKLSSLPRSPRREGEMGMAVEITASWVDSPLGSKRG